MRYITWSQGVEEVIKGADSSGKIFYALKHTLTIRGRKNNNTEGPYYSLCLPGEPDTLVLFSGIKTPKHLTDAIKSARTIGSSLARIELRRPLSIPKIEKVILNQIPYDVQFAELFVEERATFLRHLVGKGAR